MPITHAKVSAEPDGLDTALIQPTDWNAEHEGSGDELVSINISSAQLLALNTTPVQLLPAPGGRFYYTIHSAIFHYRFGTTPYNETLAYSDLAVVYGTSDTVGAVIMLPLQLGWSPAAESFDPPEMFMLTEDGYLFTDNQGVGNMPLGAWLASAVENKAVSLVFQEGLASLTGGDGSLTIRLFYSLINGAP